MTDIAPAVPSAAADRPDIDLRPLFAPGSVAVVGASPRSGHAQTILANVARIGSDCRVHYVNPRYSEIDGVPCHPSLDALPEVPDTVVLAVNPLRAQQFTREAAAAGVRSVVIPGGGVVEGGEQAAVMQREVERIAIEQGIAVLGPNCMGLVDWTTGCATYIGDVNPWLPRGHVAAIAQSGSVADAFLHSGTRIGFSRVVSCGAEVVLDVCDFLAWSLDDDETHAVLLFVEGFKRPERFLALADRALALGKPILAVKVGRSVQAQAAAIAHTGNLAGEDRATAAAFEAAGVVRCDDLDELLEAAELFAGCDRLGRNVGAGRTGVVTVSTGEASLIADLAPRTGVCLPPVPEVTRAAVVDQLPTMGYVGNPLDPWGAANAHVAYEVAFEAFASSGAFDVLAVVHDSPYRSMPGVVEIAETVTRQLLAVTRDRPDLVPVYVSLTSGEVTPEVQALLGAAGGVPFLRGAVEAFTAIAKRAWWEARRTARLAAGPVRAGWPGLADDRTLYGHDPATVRQPDTRVVHSERESLAMLSLAGVPVTPFRAVAASADAAIDAFDQLGGRPVAIKLGAPGLGHKTEAGAVRLGLDDESGVRRVVEELLDVARAGGYRLDGLLVEPMAPPGVELIVGGRRDPGFGPVVIVGLGGILAEVLDDVAVALAPVGRPEALTMLQRLRGAAILHGVRGQPPVDLEAVADVIVRVGAFVDANADAVEVDLNPVIASAEGAVAVDALVVTR